MKLNVKTKDSLRNASDKPQNKMRVAVHIEHSAPMSGVAPHAHTIDTPLKPFIVVKGKAPVLPSPCPRHA